MRECCKKQIYDVSSHFEEKIKSALDMVRDYGGTDGSHHKQWLLDEIVKKLSDNYDKWVSEYENGEEGPNTYVWDTGIAP